MEEQHKRHLVGHPSDYGSRTLKTADGEPVEERGTADSALTNDENGAANRDSSAQKPER